MAARTSDVRGSSPNPQSRSPNHDPVSSFSGPSSARSEEIAGTLRLLVALALALALMVLDHRGGWLASVRGRIETAMQPLWQLAGLPAKLGDTVRDDAVSRSRLMKENEMLRNALLISGARIARLQAASDENARLRGLLGAATQRGMDVQLAPILDIALDPTRQRLTLDIGANQGVTVGQPVIDAGGVLGQITDVRSSTATVLLLTDPDHAIPVEVARNGIRLIAYGRGDRIELANVPTSSDVKVGDLVVTSGLGGRFPPGFPVGTIVRLRRNESRAFLVGDLKPAAQLDRGRDVLLLRRAPMQTQPAAATTAPPAGETTTATTSVATPVSSKPVAAKSAGTKPAADKPVADKPAAVKPAVVKPAAPAVDAPATAAEPAR